jgi:hypothetical protein
MTQEALKLALEALEEAWIFSVSKFQPTEKAIDLYDEARAAIKEALAQTQEPWCMKMNDCKTKCEDCPDEPPQRTEQNFCSRCGKRTTDLTTIHTCTPPQENT